jgi:response regulator RpfG family c-di-GMP phosphodiesterase
MDNVNSYTVLALSDLPYQLELLTSALRAGGYKVLQAGTATAAVRIAKIYQPDLIVAAASKGFLSRFKFVRRVRLVGPLVDTPMLVVSALRLGNGMPAEGQAIPNVSPPTDNYFSSEPIELVAKVAKLRYVQKMEAVGHLAGELGFEFTNALTALYGECDLLTMDLEATAPGLAMRMGKIKDTGKRMAVLASELRAFSKSCCVQGTTELY